MLNSHSRLNKDFFLVYDSWPCQHPSEHLQRNSHFLEMTQVSSFPHPKTHLFSQHSSPTAHTIFVVQVQWVSNDLSLWPQWILPDWHHSSSGVPRCFKEVSVTLQRKWASCNSFATPFLKFSQSFYSILSYMKGVTHRPLELVRGSSHSLTIFNPVNPTYLRSCSYSAIQKCDSPPALSNHICLHTAEISILFTVFVNQHYIHISQTCRLGIKY